MFSKSFVLLGVFFCLSCNSGSKKGAFILSESNSFNPERCGVISFIPPICPGIQSLLDSSIKLGQRDSLLKVKLWHAIIKDSDFTAPKELKKTLESRLKDCKISICGFNNVSNYFYALLSYVSNNDNEDYQKFYLIRILSNEELKTIELASSFTGYEGSEKIEKYSVKENHNWAIHSVKHNYYSTTGDELNKQKVDSSVSVVDVKTLKVLSTTKKTYNLNRE